MPQIFENFHKILVVLQKLFKVLFTCCLASFMLRGEKKVLKCVFFGINNNTEILRSHGFGELNCKNVNVLEKYCSRSSYACILSGMPLGMDIF